MVVQSAARAGVARQAEYDSTPEMTGLVEYLVHVRDRDVPAEVLEKGKHHLLDTLAAIVSGSRLLPGQLGIRHVARLGGHPHCTVIGTQLRTNPVNAALANGISAHADETDDSHLEGRFHPGGGIVPAAFAAAEANGSTGLHFLRAVILGYDVGVRFNLSLGPRKPYSGGHSPHSTGPLFGASAAAGALYGFDERQWRHHLSFTIQQASGVQCWIRDHQHTEKAFDFAGMPARNALAAASMIADGFTGVDDALQEPNGFYSAFSTNPQPQRLVEELGSRYEIMRASIKKWCVGSPIQGAMDAVMAILASGPLQPESIDRIEIELPDDRAALVNARTMANVSVQHLVALAIVDAGVTFASVHDDERLHDPAIADLVERTVLTANAELTTALPPRQVILNIDLRDGTRLSHRTHAVRGTPANPMTRSEVVAKAHDLVDGIMGKDRASRLVETVLDVEHAPSLGELISLLQF